MLFHSTRGKDTDKDFATILAIVVLPTPLIPVNKKAFADLLYFIEL